MSEHPTACPACDGATLIKSGQARGRQRWRCQGCGRQFTRTEPRGKPSAVKAAAVELDCTGLSLNAIGKRLGVAAQSVLRWAGPGTTPGGTAPSRSQSDARPWSSSTRSGASSKKDPQALDLEGPRAQHRPADRLGVRRPRPSHAGAPAGPARALGRAAVLHRRLGALRCRPARRPALHRQGPDPRQREQQRVPAALVRSLPPSHLRRLQVGRDGGGDHGAVRPLPLQWRSVHVSVSRVKPPIIDCMSIHIFAL